MNKRIIKLSIAILILLPHCIILTNEQICLRNLENQMYRCTSKHPYQQKVDAIWLAAFVLDESESSRDIIDALLVSCAIGKEKVRQCKEAPDSQWPAISIKQ